MKCKEIIEILNKLAPVSMACEWDNPGLLAGRSNKDVGKILIALDATEAVIEEAIRIKADMILTHHPLIFRPVKKINDEDFIGRRLLAIIKADISYYAMHTNFDAAPGCMADLAADLLGLEKQGVLEVMGRMTAENGTEEKQYGIGKYGELKNPISLKVMAEMVKTAYQLPFVSVYGDISSEKLIKRVAICPGAGGSTVGEALKWGADVYVTGDVSHHEGIDAVANDMAVIDAGHYGIEQIFIGFMEKYLKEKLGEGITIEMAADAFPNCVL